MWRLLHCIHDSNRPSDVEPFIPYLQCLLDGMQALPADSAQMFELDCSLDMRGPCRACHVWHAPGTCGDPSSATMTSSEAEWEPLPRGLLDEMAEAKTGWQDAPPKSLRRRRRKGSSSTHQNGAAGADPLNVTNASCADQQPDADGGASAQSGAGGGNQQHTPSSTPAGRGMLPLTSR